MQHDAAITDEAARFDGASLEVHHVPDDAVVTDHGGSLGRRVQHTVVLHAGARTDGDVTVIAAQYRPGPHGAVGTNVNITDDDGIGVHEGIRMNVGNAITEGINGHVKRVPIRRDMERSAIQQIP